MKNRTAILFIISTIIIGGMYTTKLLENKSNIPNQGYSMENAIYETTSVDNLYDPDYGKLDSVLAGWIDTEIVPANINKIGIKKSILVFTDEDPSLMGIETIGKFKLGMSSIYYSQVLITDVSDLVAISKLTNVKRVIADYSSQVDLKYGDFDSQGVNLEGMKIYESISDVGQIPDSFRTREIISVSDAQAIDPNYDGSNTFIHLHDTGVDFGHIALQGTLAMTSFGGSAAFDGTGTYAAGTNFMSAEFYSKYDPIRYASQISLFNQRLYPSQNKIDLTGYSDLILYSPTYRDAYTWNDLWTNFNQISIPTEYDVTGVPGANNGVVFGVSWTRTGQLHIFIPYIMVDTDNNGDFDRIYFDWDTGFNFIERWYSYASVSEYYTKVDYSFTDEVLRGAYVDATKPYIASDWLTAYGFPGSDGFPDLSVGALGNLYDINDLDFDGDDTEIWRGIHPDGFGFSYMFDYDVHGTGVAGSIAAQDIDYTMYSLGSDPGRSLFSIQGVAPGADIIATSGLLSTSGDIWSFLWISGYEPDSTGNWVQVNQHIANISTNSWGFLSFYDSFGYDRVHGFDLYSMFMELLSNGAFADSNKVLFVISAGNYGNGYGTLSAPEPISALSVGASTNSYWRANASSDDLWSSANQGFDEIIGFSSAGPSANNYPKVDVVNVGAFDYAPAPTHPFYSQAYDDNTGSNNSYQLFGGTSQSAPYTSAALAYVYQAYSSLNPGITLSPDMAKIYLKSSAIDLGYDVYRQGAGRVDIGKAVNLVHGTGNLVSSTDGMNTAALRFSDAMTQYFGQSFAHGWGLQDTTQNYPIGYRDTAVAFGTVLEGTISNQLITTSNTVTGTDVTFQKGFSETFLGTTTSRYNYYKLSNSFINDFTGSSDYVQFILSVDQVYYEDAAANGVDFRIWILNAPDSNSNGMVDPTERELLTYGYTDYHQILITVSTKSLGPNSYLAIRDDMFHTSYYGSMTPGSSFSVTAISYSRVDDSAITVNGGATTSHTISLDTTGRQPGFYQGYIVFDDGSLAQYTYSVPFEANDYDTTSSLREANGNDYGSRDLAFDNQFMGAVSLSGQRQSGDWRFIDLHAPGSGGNDNTLAVEVNWTNPGTVLNVYIFDYGGKVISDSSPIFIKDGTWGSHATSPLNTGIRLVTDISNYDLSGNGGYFTLALHAVKHNGSLSDPIETFSFGAATLDASIDQFQINPEYVNSGAFTYDNVGNLVTENTIGINWVSNSGMNPIPRFSADGTDTTLEINRFEEVLISDYVANPVVDSGSFSSPFLVEQVALLEGMAVEISLSWDDNSDIDIVLIKQGDAFSYGNAVCGAQGATAANPETVSCTIGSSGMYNIVVIYYAGSGNGFTYELEFLAKLAVIDVTAQSSSISYNLVEIGIADGKYLLTSSTGGFNGGNSTSFIFILDHIGPQVNPYTILPAPSGGVISIGEVYDAGQFYLTVYLDEILILDNVQYNPGLHSIYIPSSYIEFETEVTFSYSSMDEFGRITSGSFTSILIDTSAPLITEHSDVIGFPHQDIEVTWIVSDNTEGSYNIYVGGVLNESLGGIWSTGELKVIFSFGSIGDYYIKLEVIDQGGNISTDQIKISILGNDVPSSSTSITSHSSESNSPAFISINTFLVILAIPILIIARKKVRTS